MLDILATGADIAPRSLRLHRKRITWTQGGTTRSAAIAR
jgi:hypothetical protein